MAALSDAARAETHGKFMREELGTFGAVTKADLRAAVNALDDYLDTNASAINLVIPLPARTVLTAAQKARLLALVVLKRWGG